jgi:hypothetical protein
MTDKRESNGNEYILVYELKCNTLLFHAMSADTSKENENEKTAMILCQFDASNSDDDEEDEEDDDDNDEVKEDKYGANNVMNGQSDQKQSLCELLCSSTDSVKSLVDTCLDNIDSQSLPMNIKIPLQEYDELRLSSNESTIMEIYNALNEIVMNLSNGVEDQEDMQDDQGENEWFFQESQETT